MMPRVPDPDRLAYLDALGIDLYRPRTPADTPAVADTAAPFDAAATNEACAAPTTGTEPGTAAAPVPTDWPGLRAAVAVCTACALHEGRTQTVFGVGNERADWMIVGEAPGVEEDRRGEPFVGRAGKLLDEMLRSLGLDRSSVFIANIVKCRPPSNRDPAAGEAACCRGFLDRQIELVRPRLILAVGRVAATRLLGVDSPVGRLRGKSHLLLPQRIPVVVTYHPAYLLRQPSAKRKSWADLCLARQVRAETAA